MQFGKIIEEARIKAELNQKQVAALILKEDSQHISAPYLNDIERNRRIPSSDYMIEQFSKVLKIQLEFLYYAAGKIPPWAYDYRINEERIIAAFEAFKLELYNRQGALPF